MRTNVTVLAAMLVMSAIHPADARSQKTGNPNCPPAPAQKGLMGQKGSSGSEVPAKQPAEKSAILPSAGQNEQSSAPTVQQDGKTVESETSCERAPNAPR